MKLHMVSVYINGRTHTWFQYFPIGVKPFVDTNSDEFKSIVKPGNTFSCR